MIMYTDKKNVLIKHQRVFSEDKKKISGNVYMLSSNWMIKTDMGRTVCVCSALSPVYSIPPWGS